jgi:hypothetical protein
MEKFIPFPNNEVIKPDAALYTGGYKFKHAPELSQFHLVVGYEGLSIHSDEYYKLDKEIKQESWTTYTDYNYHDVLLIDK